MPEKSQTVERIQTGVRLEKRLVKVMKALAEHKDMTLSDLIEGIVLHAFDGVEPFSAETRDVIARLKAIYGLDLSAEDSHRLRDRRESNAG
jgi:predicted DNA-binding ribbon-helix-helix protein